ncbi:sensor histidine kinase [Mesobacillus subterraneus]|uniref:sensor histidine kinase n=1 Tax=Mesobacillus subterraneus TaxID=285983 RepID=UPI002041EE5C|nr:sensor histidine kinase [Mesobacillus subterraneus]MCM3666876.1 sensor histidine kinase [Mesobacillus subterraneus]MCM3684950.1 sensor histidine kinase [Mesobacillus subterraneus]
MFELLLTMLERLGIIVTIAFILTRFRFFRGLIYHDSLNRRQQYFAIVFFGFFGIIGTYSGMSFNTDTLQFNRWAADLASDEAIANSRVIGIVIAGLLGGYKVGIGAGLIAGLHRFTLGGFTALACGLAAIVAGIIAGRFQKKKKNINLATAFMVGAIAETVQMLIILLMAKPFDKALTLVEIIGVPMILANGLGSALFLMVVRNVVSEEEKAGALLAQKTLRIADQTLAYLRKGINQDSALAVCQILHNEVQTSAVAMTNQTEILAHIGLGDDHHRSSSPIQTQITRDVLKSGSLVVANDETIHCREQSCPLGAVVIAPLKQRDETIGTLKFYFKSEKEITNVVIELISGLSNLLSNQLEIAEADKAYQLAKEAEIKALQAQISPHFLFNTMNVITSLIRIDPAKARMLLVSLSHFLRQNLTATTVTITTLEQELRHVKAYLSIEEARFVEKLKVTYEIDDEALLVKIPPLTLQPIVENAVKHGIKNMDQDCHIHITIHKGTASTLVSVEDNGQGMSEDRINQLGNQIIDSEKGSGIALFNVNRRLTMMFGKKASLQIESEPGKGTKFTFSIPQAEEF